MDNNKKHPLEEILGDKIIVKKSHANNGEEKKEMEEGGNDVTAESVVPLSSLLQNGKTKRIILYFSAHWCGPCRGFTPLLSAAYDGYKKKTSAAAAEAGDESAFASAETEVIFVSRDRDEEAFKAYYGKEMSFLALPYDDGRSRELMQKFGVQGIPTMVAIDAKTGDVENTTADFRSLVGEYGADAFPLSAERISELEAARDAKIQQALKSLYDGNLSVVATESSSNGGSGTGVMASNDKFSLKELLHKNDHVGILLGDGDASDPCYEAASDALKKVKSKSNMNRCAVVYVGWSLYNESSDHGKLNPKFDYYYDGGDDGVSSQETLKTIENVFGGKAKAKAPQLMILRKGSGLCSINGKCEDEGVPVLVSLDPGLRKVVSTGAGAFPWDEATMDAHEKAKKARIENLRLQLKGMRFLTTASDDSGDSSPPAVVVPENGDGLSLKERLFVDGDQADNDAVIGLYFSASWCGPCVSTTPKLVQCYEKVAAAGKKFEIVFVSSDSSQDDFEKYHKKMTTESGGRQFLALDYSERELKQALSTLFGVRGIPTLVLLKPNGTIINVNGVRAAISGGVESFPWDENTIERVKKEKMAAALNDEKDAAEAQVALGVPLVKRLIGEPGQVKHNVAERTLAFGRFSTAGVPNMMQPDSSGVVYYELEVLEGDGVAQFGFSMKDGLQLCDKYSSVGVGDEATSWGVDGVRKCKWNGGPISQPCSWVTGSVIGLAANINKGMIAVSKDGNWETDGFGIVFNNKDIKEGVYPCFTASSYKVRYCFSQSCFKHGPPNDSLWDSSKGSD